MIERPEPHPLDFDWRFTADTTRDLAKRIGYEPCIAVGAPSVAEALQGTSPVTLIDRHPVQLCEEHLVLDPGSDPPCGFRFQSAIVDPPWYPRVYKRWLSWTSHATGPGGVLWATLWPSDTRPTAEQERSELLAWAATWASVSLQQGVLEYETPLFEAEALRAAGVDERTPRRGDLICLHVREVPSLSASIQGETKWARFVFGNYQLALRLKDDGDTPPCAERHPLTSGWTWPSVSRRATGRNIIDLWSSRNEVAVVQGTSALRARLRRYARSGLTDLDDQRSTILGPLNAWQIPFAPSERVLEWTHRS